MSDLYTVQLIEGFTVKGINSKDAVYKTVYLRESTEQILHDAMKQVQELRHTNDGWRLVHNQEMWLTARIIGHIAKITGSGPELLGSDIDMSVLGKLHPLDVALISERLLHIELAAQLRWQLISQDEYDMILLGKSVQRAKQPTPEELLLSVKKMMDCIARVAHTPLDVLGNMPLAELVVTLQNLADTGK